MENFESHSVDLFSASQATATTADKPPAGTLSDPVIKASALAPVQHDVPEVVDPLLAIILSWPRPHESAAERLFRTWLTDKLVTLAPGRSVQVLAEGCLYLTIPRKASEVLPNGSASTTLFSCHIDTVDAQIEGALVEVDMDGTKHMLQKVKQLTYDPNFGSIALDSKSAVGTCLGADDGIGVWIMLKMIEAGVPGGYIFHTGEERGCIGSNAVLSKDRDILKPYEVAVAFDRPRDNEVITHQGGQECCSNKFGKALAAALNAQGMAYETSNRGAFTDTKVYRRVIAECVNLGVGYEFQHSRNEVQDYAHANALMKAAIALAWDSLPVDRDPAKIEAYQGGRGYQGGYHGGYTGVYGGYDHLDDFKGGGWKDRRWVQGYMGKNGVWVDGHWDYPADKKNVTPITDAKPKTNKKSKRGARIGQDLTKRESLTVFDELRMYTNAQIVSWIESEQPADVAMCINALMVEIGELRASNNVMKKLLDL